nr:hypothetical protein 7 [Deltaproteobacteria bacterium]
MAITAVLSALGGAVTSWFQNKGEEARAKHTRKLREINGEIEAETEVVKGMSQSWKDEYLTLVFTSPLVLIFYACLMEDDKMLANVFKAFDQMQRIPQEWWWTIGAITLGTFGLRGYNAWKGGTR